MISIFGSPTLTYVPDPFIGANFHSRLASIVFRSSINWPPWSVIHTRGQIVCERQERIRSSAGCSERFEPRENFR